MRDVSAPAPRANVVGGGPAGLIAAEVLATHGFAVTVYDHMPSMGRKLLLAGRSGLNLTHGEPLDDLLDRYGDARPRLEEAVRAFGPEHLRNWAAALGEDTYLGTSGRVFPDSWRATPLLRAWLARLDDLGVVLQPRHRWTGWALDEQGNPRPDILQFARADGTTVEIAGEVTVLALGGASWPRVGSDGTWVDTLRSVGVDVVPLVASNAGIDTNWSQHFVERFEGVPLKNVTVTVASKGVRGDLMVTSSGLEGLPVYSHSAALRAELSRSGIAHVEFDLHPDLDVAVLTRRLGRRRPKDSTSNWLRRSAGLAPIAIALLRECTENSLPDDPATLAALVKHAVLPVRATAGIDRAISSAGGVSLAEVDDHFMLRRLPGTFMAGEMLDWEAPTGGYLLQASFSTAVAAANGAIEWAKMSNGRSGQS